MCLDVSYPGRFVDATRFVAGRFVVGRFVAERFVAVRFVARRFVGELILQLERKK